MDEENKIRLLKRERGERGDSTSCILDSEKLSRSLIGYLIHDILVFLLLVVVNL